MITTRITIIIATILILTSQVLAADKYIKFDGVDGGSTAQDHLNWSDLISFSTVYSQENLSSCNIVVNKVPDKATPKMLEKLFVGEIFSTVEIDFVDDSAERNVFINVLLTDARISKFSLIDSSGEDCTNPELASKERLVISWEEMKFTFSEIGQGYNETNITCGGRP